MTEAYVTTAAELRKLDQVTLLDVLLAEEKQLDFDSFTLDDAWIVGQSLRATAQRIGIPIGIGIVLGEHRAFHAGVEGSSALNDAWLERKFRVVRHHEHSSLAVRAQYLAAGEEFETHSLLDPMLYAAAGGAFPVRVRGTLVGVVGVSGLEMHEDHALVVQHLRAHLHWQRGSR